MTLKLNIKVPKGSKLPSKRNILYGTGLTKVVANQQIKSAAKPAKEKLVLNLEAKKQIAVNIDIATTTLPSSLMSSDIILDKDQQIALEGMENQKYACLIGSAGTGKTTTLKALVSQLENSMSYVEEDGEKVPAIAFCSFMGKAVQQMKRALPKKYHPLCMTIHALLGFRPEMLDYEDEEGNMQTKMQFLPEFTEYNKLGYKCIVIDEGGTVPIPLWHYLLLATITDCRIFILGDLNQLTPVAGHSILGFAGLKWPTYELKTLHRNAGPIAENAHRVINGFKPMTDEITRKVTVKKLDDGSITARKQILGIIRYLYENGKFDPMQDAIIVPQNVDTLGQEQLNEILVNLFNKDAKRISIKAGIENKVFAVGDKVMLLKNNNKVGLTNGMQGVITEIAPNNNFAGNHIENGRMSALVEIDLANFDSQIAIVNDTDIIEENSEQERAASHIVTVQFQDVTEPQVLSTVGELSHITISYVFTCHKAQGSEYRFVIALCHSATRKMLSREWLYTAMTRAKENLLILCNNRGLAHAVGTQRIKGITMQEKFQKFIAMTKALPDDKQVQLPDAKELIQPKIQFNVGEK